MKNLVLLACYLLFAIAANGQSLSDGVDEWKVLDCLQRRNITIVLGDMYEELFEPTYSGEVSRKNYFYHYFEVFLRELERNDYCYSINIFIPYEGRVMRYTGDISIFHDRVDVFYSRNSNRL